MGIGCLESEYQPIPMIPNFPFPQKKYDYQSVLNLLT